MTRKPALLERFTRWAADGLRALGVAASFGIVSLVLGHGLLEEGLRGDAAMHLAYATWLERFFPSIPHWFPLQGGGVSLLHGYPLLSHFGIVALHRVSGLSLYQSLSVLSFVSFPLIAYGTYLFAAAVFRSRVAGFIAGLFYLLSPISWTWMHDWGFFAQQIGQIFLPISLLAFHHSLHLELKGTRDGRRRLWLTLLVVTLVISMLCHPLIGVAGVVGMTLYGLFRVLTTPRAGRGRTARAGLKLLILALVLVSVVGAAHFVPFAKYGQVANREGLNSPDPSFMPRIHAAQLLGTRPIDQDQIISRMQFPLAVAGFAVLGGFIGLLKRDLRSNGNGTVLAWASVLTICVVYAVSPSVVDLVHSVSQTLARLISFRSTLIISMVLMPAMAAHGCSSAAAALVGSLADGLRRIGMDQRRRVLLSTGKQLGYVSAAIVLCVAGLTSASRLQSPHPWFLDLGPARLDTRDIWGSREDDPCAITGEHQASMRHPICSSSKARSTINVSEFELACHELLREQRGLPQLCHAESPDDDAVEAFLEFCEASAANSENAEICSTRNDSLVAQLLPSRWVETQLHNAEPETASHRMLAEAIAGGPARIDLSPHHGRLLQDQAVYSGASQIATYTSQLSLNHLLWGLQIKAFYLDSSSESTAVSSLADWLGIGYVVLDPLLDPVSNFPTDEWEVVFTSDRFEVRRYIDALPLASTITQPTVLVLGSPRNSVYAELFARSNAGLAPYEALVLVEGQRPLDRYSVDELNLFDGIFLHGYDYADADLAWSNLEQYVARGGAVFVDTGWQFEIPEWEFVEAPSVLPVGNLAWTELPVLQGYDLSSEFADGQIDVSGFGPLIWQGGPWGISSTSAEHVREWGEIILSANGLPLIIAGEYGQGKVVWSGMNFLSHLSVYGNSEEVKLLDVIVNWLYDGQRESTEQPQVARTDPDSVVFTFQSASDQPTWLYWRESYYPNWHARLLTDSRRQELPVYRAGPGYMLIPVNTVAQDSTVTLTWERSPDEALASILTAGGSLLLLGLALDGLVLDGKGLTWVKIALVSQAPRPFLGDEINKDWLEEKRRQIQNKDFLHGPRRYELSEAVPWVQSETDPASGHGHSVVGDEESAPRDQAADDAANSMFEAEASKDPNEVPVDDHDAMLRRWVESAGHQDDQWATKLLGGRREPKQD